MVKNSLIDKLKNLEQEHRDIDEVLIQLQEKQRCNNFLLLNKFHDS